MPSPAQTRRLLVESLEERAVPANYAPWPDADRLTLSFAPDSTTFAGQASNLTSAFSGVNAEAQKEILRAFQAWASVTNINIGVVSDSGDPLGTPGLPVGDSRFGDIRIAGVPQTDEVLALNTPYQPAVSNTLSGDVVINTAKTFSLNDPYSYDPDLYSALLDEAANVLGLSDNQLGTSARAYLYAGFREGLSADDIDAIQSLYGVRVADALEGTSGNETFGTASTIATPGGFDPATQTISVPADITTTSDVDTYQFTTLGSEYLSNGVTVRARVAGVSLLTGTLAVYDQYQNVVGTATASGVPGSDLSVTITSPTPNATYYVKVQAEGSDVFGVGAYGLEVDYRSSSAPTLPPARTTAPAAPAGHLEEDGELTTSSQQDSYTVTAPTGSSVLTAYVWSTSGALAPKITVTDASNNPVAANIVRSDSGGYSIQAVGVTPNETYHVIVSALDPAGASATGDYTLAVDFDQPEVVQTTMTSGEFTSDVPSSIVSLTAVRSQYTQLSLSSTAAANTIIEATITDVFSNVIATISIPAGETTTFKLFLPSGVYFVYFNAYTTDYSLLPNVGYSLTAFEESNPIGITPVDVVTYWGDYGLDLGGTGNWQMYNFEEWESNALQPTTVSNDPWSGW